MNIKEARTAIEAILAAIDDDALPAFDRIETDEHGTYAYWGSTGWKLGSMRRGGERRPIAHRESGSWAAVEREMVYRADADFFANGDAIETSR